VATQVPRTGEADRAGERPDLYLACRKRPARRLHAAVQHVLVWALPGCGPEAAREVIRAEVRDVRELGEAQVLGKVVLDVVAHARQRGGRQAMSGRNRRRRTEGPQQVQGGQQRVGVHRDRPARAPGRDFARDRPSDRLEPGALPVRRQPWLFEPEVPPRDPVDETRIQ
jgi:hypothetical protein